MKLFVDILMFIIMILEFSRSYISPLIHEILGIILFILVIIHLILNKKYLKNIFKGKYNILRIIMLIINIGFLISFIPSIIFGMLSSTELLTFMNINNLNIVKLHKILSYSSFIFMGLHLGVNSGRMLGKMDRIINNIYVVYILKIIIVIYGIYSFIKLDILKHLTGEYGFSIVNGSIILNIIEYLSVVLMLSIIMNIINKLVKRKGD